MTERYHGKGREREVDNEEYDCQESELRPDAGLVVRGKMRLNKLVRWCPVLRTKGR